MVSRQDQVAMLEKLAEPVCAAHGVELVQLRVMTHRGEGVVRLIIDRERPDGHPAGPDGSGVSLDDCTAVSRDLSTALDVHEELFSGRYRLEVSSPGLERPLVKLADYERFEGREAKVKCKVPIDGRRKFQGTILGVDGDRVKIDQDGTTVEIPFEDIDRANLVYRF